MTPAPLPTQTPHVISTFLVGHISCPLLLEHVHIWAILEYLVFKSLVLESQKDWQLNQTATNLDQTAVVVLGGP